MDNLSLVVSSCDKYSSAWRPYFELLKIYWPEHPEDIHLISETKKYVDNQLNIINHNFPKSYTWSERLYETLKSIKSEYILFSLEDFFLMSNVDQGAIDKCIKWMSTYPKIAQCRLSSRNTVNLGKYWDNSSSFRIAGPDVPFRLDTQVAIWRKDDLINFIDKKEDPWQFEGWGTERIKASDKIFLWHYQENENDITKMLFPYFVDPKMGYGIAWGHWLWNNKRWFKKNGIRDVKFWKLGVLSKKAVDHRYKYVYNKANNEKNILRLYYNLCRQAKYAWHNLMSMGFKEGLLKSLKTLKKHI